jgi:hypothetical protein
MDKHRDNKFPKLRMIERLRIYRTVSSKRPAIQAIPKYRKPKRMTRKTQNSWTMKTHVLPRHPSRTNKLSMVGGIAIKALKIMAVLVVAVMRVNNNSSWYLRQLTAKVVSALLIN